MGECFNSPSALELTKARFRGNENDEKEVKPMDNNTEYMTIKQFADAANVTPQRIYKLLSKGNGLNNGLSNKLKPYIKIENNQKYLDIRALELFEKSGANQQVEQPIEQRVERSCNDQSSQVAIAALSDQLEVLQQQLAAKDSQLSAKDKQIEQLTAALRTAQEQQTALTTALTQQQALHAGDIQRQLTEQREPPERMPDDATAPEAVPPAEIVPEEDQDKKLSFFARLFKRK